MKRCERRTWVTLLIGLILFFCGVHDTVRAQGEAQDHDRPGAPDISKSVGYIEDISFTTVSGKERVTIAVSRQTGASVESQPGKSVLVKMDNMFIPEQLRKPLGEGILANLIRVVPIQRSDNGNPTAHLKIELGKQVPYSVRQEGNNVIIDFNIAAADIAEKVKPQKEVGKEKAEAVPASVPPSMAGISAATGKGNVDIASRVIDLDFQDADIRMLLRLLAEEGHVNIVYGDDVKGNITLSLKRVPWERALDTILDIRGMVKAQEGNVITVMTSEKNKKITDDLANAEQQRLKTEDSRRERYERLLVEQGKLKQISIEAKIVEVSTDFSRSLGMLWGYGYKDTWQGRDVGFMVGNSATSSRTSVANLPGGIGLTTSNLAVNFPSSSVAVGPAIGLILGSSKFILDAKLEAMQSSGNGKIISAPKIMTMDNVEAKIGQGEEIPYIVRDLNGSPTVQMKDAKLGLRVKPKITAEGKISMEIETENKYADWTKVNTSNENPPLISSDVRSKVVLNDGDTVVVGGIYKSTESDGVSGVPWLSNVPVLGWLFKTSTKTKQTREILIFVTPKIIKEG